MALRAESDPRYYRRFLIMGVAALGFALWSLYDGAIKYPQQRERALALAKLSEEKRLDEWNDLARQRGWPTSTAGLGEPKSEADIIMQYVMAAMAGAVGLGLLIGVWRARGRWIEATDSGILSSWGQSLAFDQVLAIDKRKWRDKGIAKVRYQDGRRRRRFVLDDYKFEREATDQILYHLESNVGHDKIVGGPPEAAMEESGEEATALSPEESGRQN